MVMVKDIRYFNIKMKMKSGDLFLEKNQKNREIEKKVNDIQKKY